MGNPRRDTDEVQNRGLSRLERIILIAAPVALVAVMAAGLAAWRDQGVLVRAVEELAVDMEKIIQWIDQRRQEIGRDEQRLSECEKRFRRINQ